MDFKDQIHQLGERVAKLKVQILTEEATKNALIMPFIQVLGYDVFNPLEVVPEFIADIGIKKGEKVDYAIFIEKQPMILVECKHWGQKLDIHDNQLLRYFNVTKAKFAILTNGVKFKFYTDLVEPNKMDEKPFLEFDLPEMKEQQIEELKKFHKSYFDVANILSSASEMKYTNELKLIVASEFKNPSDGFVRFFASQAYTGRLTDKVVFQFSDFVRKSVHQVISDMITDRLKSALNQEQEAASQTETNKIGEEAITENGKERVIETTAEEMEGFFIVKSILRQHVDSSRIGFRDALSYFSILLDDNNRKTICRLYFNSTRKYIGIIDAAKKEAKYEIFSLDDIYKYSEQLNQTVETYVALKS